MTDSIAAPHKFRGHLVWLLKIVVALAFAAAAFFKLSGQPKMIEEFGKIGLGQGFRYLTGAIELVCAGLLLWPRTAFYGAVGLFCVCAGALIAQIGPLHGDLVHVFVLGGLTALAGWLSRPGVMRG